MDKETSGRGNKTMNEQSKAAKRRQLDPRFTNRWFVGEGLDVGCGEDPIDVNAWPNISSLTGYDQIFSNAHDAQTLCGLDSEQFDFIHSAHCLEHLKRPASALRAWLDVLKPGGFIVCTVPDWVLYESCQWPSRNNSDHKAAFTMGGQLAGATFEARKAGLKLYNMVDLFETLGELVPGGFTLEHLTLLSDKYKPLLFGTDQTLGEAECAIEFVLQKALPAGELFRTVVAIPEP